MRTLVYAGWFFFACIVSHEKFIVISLSAKLLNVQRFLSDQKNQLHLKKKATIFTPYSLLVAAWAALVFLCFFSAFVLILQPGIFFAWQTQLLYSSH